MEKGISVIGLGKLGAPMATALAARGMRVIIALGSVIRDFLNPDLLPIGESDERSGALMESLYRSICENRPGVARMNFVNAGIAKLLVSTYVTTKINFANMPARLCEKVPGASVDVVTGAIGLDSRIESKYLKGAISYAAPCSPRVVIDFWRSLKHLESAKGVLYMVLGNGIVREESSAGEAAQ